MQYLFAAHTDEHRRQTLTPDQREQEAAAILAYVGELEAAGALVGVYRWEPSSAAKTVRFVNGGTEIQDGPYADLAEPMTGLYIIDVPDEEAALLWAERHPGTRAGAIEVRPVSMPPPRLL
jgi:hypothetical protein